MNTDAVLDMLILGKILFLTAGAFYLFVSAAERLSGWASRRSGRPKTTGSVDRSRAGTTGSAEWASGRPAVGTLVRLERPADGFLARYHDVHPGDLGRVTRWSGLAPDDDGVLVDWGDGKEIRTDLAEIGRVKP